MFSNISGNEKTAEGGLNPMVDQVLEPLLQPAVLKRRRHPHFRNRAAAGGIRPSVKASSGA